jgi:hypothetical protein
MRLSLPDFIAAGIVLYAVCTAVIRVAEWAARDMKGR